MALPTAPPALLAASSLEPWLWIGGVLIAVVVVWVLQRRRKKASDSNIYPLF